MHKIRFTYTSTEIEPSVFLLLFFRMVGIYVYERFFDSTVDDQRELLQVLDEKDSCGQTVWDDFDLDLYYVQSSEELEAISKYGNKNSATKELIVLSQNAFGKMLNISLPHVMFNTVNYTFLSNLLSEINGMGIIDNKKQKQLDACGNIYCTNDVWELTLKSKYFYAAENDAFFENTIVEYQKIVTQLLDLLESSRSKWGNEDSLYIQYSILNIAYEGNQYCSKNRKSMLYSPKELFDICKSLLSAPGVVDEIKERFSLLLAQICSDLLKDPYDAYRYCDEACNNYNAYAYFKLASYWQDYVRDYARAIEFYSTSVSIYPEYYRAWYRMGTCYMSMANCKKALSVFQNVVKILEPRQKQNSIRPMEIEYLFKTHNQCAFVWNKVLGNRKMSLNENYKAVEAWEAIEHSQFFDKLLGEKDEDGPIRKQTQNELNINKIYYEISKLKEKMKATQV